MLYQHLERVGWLVFMKIVCESTFDAYKWHQSFWFLEGGGQNSWQCRISFYKQFAFAFTFSFITQHTIISLVWNYVIYYVNVWWCAMTE